MGVKNAAQNGDFLFSHKGGERGWRSLRCFASCYFVGEPVTRITRTALTLRGAHAIFKTSPLERFFRDAQQCRSNFLQSISAGDGWSVGTGARSCRCFRR